MFNCPNCGAPITGNQCAYCGTLFELKTTREADFYAQNELYLQLRINALNSQTVDLVRQQINASIASQQVALLSSMASCNNYTFGGK